MRFFPINPFDDQADESPGRSEEGDDFLLILIVDTPQDEPFMCFIRWHLILLFGIFICSAPIAQLDRVPGFEPGGYRFKSCSVHNYKCLKSQYIVIHKRVILSASFLCLEKERITQDLFIPIGSERGSLWD